MRESVSTMRDILANERAWSATPWDYSSMRFLIFKPDGTAEFMYGYGQTIYARINCTFECSGEDRLVVSYLESPKFQLSQPFSPTDGNRRVELVCRLTKGDFEFVESIVRQPRRFQYQLDLDRSPFPEGLNFPHEVPLTYYGHPI